MARVKQHAKVHTSLKSHRKTVEMFADNDMLAMYTRIILAGIERFANRTGDAFTIQKSELEVLSGKRRADVALKSLERLANITPISFELRGNVVEIEIPNFAKKQGFEGKNVQGTARQPSAPETEAETEAELRGTAVAVPVDLPPAKSTKTTSRSRVNGTKADLEIYTRMRARAAAHGKTWREEPSKSRLDAISKRRRIDGLNVEQFEQIVDGAVSLWSDTDMEIGKYLVPETLLRPSNWPKYLDAHQGGTGGSGFNDDLVERDRVKHHLEFLQKFGTPQEIEEYRKENEKWMD